MIVGYEARPATGSKHAAVDGEHKAFYLIARLILLSSFIVQVGTDMSATGGAQLFP